VERREGCRSDGFVLVLKGVVVVVVVVVAGYLHVIMETKGGKKSKKSSIQYESPLGYVIEDVRPHGGSEKFRTAAYSNVSEGFGCCDGVGIRGICVSWG